MKQLYYVIYYDDVYHRFFIEKMMLHKIQAKKYNEDYLANNEFEAEYKRLVLNEGLRV